MGVHQRIDRIARRSITPLLPTPAAFPGINDIIHFEGLHGPDGIKRKSPGKDEPWHYFDPHDRTDRRLLDIINDHRHNLTEALATGDRIRAAFEAAWLAHSITDGLTLAHHYPLEKKLVQLRGGKGLETRASVKEKLILPGKTRRHQLRNNWTYWGAKGIMTTHIGFELGVAAAITGRKIELQVPTEDMLLYMNERGFEEYFFDEAVHIDNLQLYQEYTRLGWTRHLAAITRDELVPTIIRMIALVWMDCARKAAKL